MRQNAARGLHGNRHQIARKGRFEARETIGGMGIFIIFSIPKAFFRENVSRIPKNVVHLKRGMPASVRADFPAGSVHIILSRKP